MALGGAVGAVTRSVVYQWYAKLEYEHRLPVPTLLVNIIGSMIMGITFYCLVEKSMLPQVWKDTISIGFLGVLTTFSTLSLDVLRLLLSPS